MEVISLEGPRGLRPEGMFKQGDDASDGDGTDGTLEGAWISISSQTGDLLLLLFF